VPESSSSATVSTEHGSGHNGPDNVTVNGSDHIQFFFSNQTMDEIFSTCSSNSFDFGTGQSSMDSCVEGPYMNPCYLAEDSTASPEFSNFIRTSTRSDSVKPTADHGLTLPQLELLSSGASALYSRSESLSSSSDSLFFDLNSTRSRSSSKAVEEIPLLSVSESPPISAKPVLDGHSLMSHQKRLTIEAPRHTRCGFCEMSFSDLVSLNRHQRTSHTMHKCSFSSSGCRVECTTSAGLKQHENAVHHKLKPYSCEFTGCSKRFSRRDNRNRHSLVCIHYSVTKRKGGKARATKSGILKNKF
jgi:uncharacterized Zn-finger protein